MGEYVTLDRTFYSLILVTGRIRDIGQRVLQSSCGNWANTWHLGRTFYSLILVNGRIRDIGQNVLQSSFGNWANTWHWTERFTVFFW